MKDITLTIHCLICKQQENTPVFTTTSKAVSKTKRRKDVIEGLKTHMEDAHPNVWSQLQAFLIETASICSEMLFVDNCIDSVEGTNVDEIHDYMDDRVNRLIDILGLDDNEDDGEEEEEDNESEYIEETDIDPVTEPIDTDQSS